MDERKQEESLLNTFRELDKEDRYKLLNVGEIMVALKNINMVVEPRHPSKSTK